MCWPVLAAIARAVGHYQIGAMSVWVTVLLIALKAVLLAMAVAALSVVGIVARRGFAW